MIKDNSIQTDSDIKRWYVLRAVFHGEVIVRDMLRREGIQCYVPMYYRVDTVRQRKVRRLVPAVRELVFVYSTQNIISDFKRRCKKKVYWLMRPSALGPERIIIPDKDMDNFIRITQQHEREVTYFHPDELSLSKGDSICIHGGPFNGVEGVLLKIKGKRDRQLVVSIPGIAAATVSVRPELVELKSNKEKRSKNLDGDMKELLRLATQMLLSPPDSVKQAPEYDMLCFEIHRLYVSLKSLRGFLPGQEGELSLSLLMAERVFATVQHETILRFRHALSKLDHQTLLGVRMLWIGGILLQDDILVNNAQQIINRWQSAGTSPRQKKLIADIRPWKSLQLRKDNGQ